MEIFIQTIGWMGTALVLAAYFLVSMKKIEADSRVYQGMNLLGVIGVGMNVFHQQAWPAVALQTIWGLIAVFALMRKI